MAPARLAVVVLVALLATAVLPATASASSPADQMLWAVNGVRSQQGAPPLRSSPRLIRGSNAHARRMLRRNFFGHGAVGGPGRGEVLAIHTGRGVSVGQVLGAWMSSGGHRHLLLDRSFRRVGIARAVGRMRRGSATVWVVRLG